MNKDQLVYALAAFAFTFLIIQGITLPAVEFVFCTSIKYIPEQIGYMLLIPTAVGMFVSMYMIYKFRNR